MNHRSNHNQPEDRAHWTTHLRDAAATDRLGGSLAQCLAPGMRIYLHGELGTGKTTLIRGLLHRLGVRGGVKSPSYTLVELYVVSRLYLYHFDFYRFLSPNEFEAAGLADYFHGDGVCLVEWPEKAAGALPSPDLELWFTYASSGRDIEIDAITGTGERCLTELRNA